MKLLLVILTLPTLILSIKLRARQDGQFCPVDTPLSCSTSNSNVNSCCTNTPGGLFVQTQFWDSPTTGPTDSWTIHGLWPDNCSGKGYQQFCDKTRESTDITGALQNAGQNDLLDYMNTFWKDANGNDESFWEHEWNKHGTCVSTLEPACFGDSYVPQEELVAYFNATVALFQTLPTYDWLTAAGIVPSNSETYSLDQLQQVANDNFGFDAVWGCQNGMLNQVWWGYHSQGSVAGGNFIPSQPSGLGSTCPQDGISWLPKN